MSEVDFSSSYERSFLLQTDPKEQERPEQRAYSLNSWRSMMEQAYGDLDFNSALNDGFHAGLRVSRLHGFNAFAIRGTELTAQRTLRQTSDEETGQIIMIWQLSGEATAMQRGNEVELKSGEIVFLDFDTPYVVDCRTEFNQFVVQIPKKTLDSHPSFAGNDFTLHASKFGQDHMNKARPWLALLNQILLEAVIWGNELLPSSLISSSVDSIANLARLSLPGSQTTPIRGIDFNYVLEVIKREAIDSDFDSLKLAKELNVSRRTLFRIFEEAGESFEALRLRARLHHAELLLGYGGQNNSVEYIAHKTGFKSVSHFHEKFQETHSRTPNEYRKQMAQQLSGEVTK